MDWTNDTQKIRWVLSTPNSVNKRNKFLQSLHHSFLIGDIKKFFIQRYNIKSKKVKMRHHRRWLIFIFSGYSFSVFSFIIVTLIPWLCGFSISLFYERCDLTNQPSVLIIYLAYSIDISAKQLFYRTVFWFEITLVTISKSRLHKEAQSN